MLIKILLYEKKTSWEQTEQIWFQERCASWKKMFGINKMTSIPMKTVYLYKLPLKSGCSKKSCKISKKAFLVAFSLETFENWWLCMAASKQFKIASFHLIQFLMIVIVSAGVLSHVTRKVHIKILQHSLYRISVTMRSLENHTQRIFNNSIKQNQKLGSPVNKCSLSRV